MKHIGEVWVYIQRNKEHIADASFEMLGKAKELASVLKVPVAGLISGSCSAPLADKPIAYGADKVYVLQSPYLENYSTNAYAKSISVLIKEKKPSIFLLAATLEGRDLAPRIASLLRVGLTADCTDLQIGLYTHPKTRKKYEKILLQIRPAWGGNIIATIVNPETRPQMATIREGMMRLPVPDDSAAGEIIRVSAAVESGDVKTAILQHVYENKTVNLKGAKVIVAGGAGVGSAENFELIKNLAHAFGGEVGATRAAVDAGFVSREHQIGQTGITVRPKLYIACGISGAVQHLTGMDKSGKVVAVNTDPDAPVFSVAHYGIIGDLRDAVPKIINIYKELSH